PPTSRRVDKAFTRTKTRGVSKHTRIFTLSEKEKVSRDQTKESKDWKLETQFALLFRSFLVFVLVVCTSQLQIDPIRSHPSARVAESNSPIRALLIEFGDSDAEEISRVVLCVYQAGK
ncbi:hypothetical protein CUMW_028310, partial [Citrus unshiu]